MATKIRRGNPKELVQVWVDPPLFKGIEAAAQRHQMTRPEFIRTVLGLMASGNLKLQLVQEGHHDPHT